MKCDSCGIEREDLTAGQDMACTLICRDCLSQPPPAHVITQMLQVRKTACMQPDCHEFFPIDECCPVHSLPGWIAWLGQGDLI